MAESDTHYQTFTDANVLRLPKPDQGQRFYYDSKQAGLALRVAANDVRAFVIVSWDKASKRTRRYVIGTPQKIGVDAARAAVRARLGDAAIGKPDPFGREAKKRDQITLKRAFEDYLQARPLKPLTVEDYRKRLNIDLFDWYERSLATISRDDVEKRHALITQRSPATANVVFKVFSAVYTFAIDKYETNGQPVLTHNPVRRLSAMRLWNKVAPRKSAVPLALMPALIRAAFALENAAGDALVLIAYTGMRKSEALSLPWTGVDFKRGRLRVPDTKSKTPLDLPLTRQVRALLERRHHANAQAATPSLLVFAPAYGEMLNPMPAVASVGATIGHPFVPHDLRRSFITAGRNAGIPEAAVKALVNHALPSASGNITSGYYAPSTEELAGFAQLLADTIDAGGKPAAQVVPIRGRRRNG